ncbi:peptidase domain-containing ABC transporter [Marinifilum fragile]|uniref:peptidase domain-containing ABC transporter n=1 Tax=Marinifilum fragile TaxID=570161 RepID=UPI0006CF53B5|nr:peptidase domain-containing ABC transporter [Marinifilum fragile]
MNWKIVKKAKKSFTLQQDYADCGIACLLSVIKYFGGAGNFESLREWSGTSKQGTTLLGLYQAAKKSNLSAKAYQAEFDNLKDTKHPLILHLELENGLEHYVVFYGFHKNKLIIGDPGRGVCYYTQNELLKVWKSKALLTLQPEQSFIHKEETTKQKRNWIKNMIQEDSQILMVSIFIGVLIAGLSLAVSVFNQKLIDDILPSKEFSKVIIAIALLSLLLVSHTFLNAVRNKFLYIQSHDFNIRMVNSFFKQLLNLPKSFFDNRRSGDMIARLNDSARIQAFLSKVAGNFIIEILILVVSILVLFFYSTTHGILTLLFLPIYATILIIFNKRIVSGQKNVMEHYAHNESFYINSLNGIETIKNTNTNTYFENKNLTIYTNFQDKILNLGKLTISLSFLSGVLGTIYMASIIGVGAQHVITDIISLGALIAMIGISTRISPALTSIISMLIQVQEAKVAFDRLFEMININTNSQKTNKSISKLTDIQIKNLNFRFPGRSLLLKNINLKIQKGKIASLLGESGTGKSTLASILQKFYFPENGDVFINDIPINEISNTSLRSQIGHIPQNIHIFNNTLAFNILLEDVNDQNLTALKKFCEEWGFDKFFDVLPQGLSTKVGEDGINLSGGQKQLLAFARIFYKKPEFIILDEATSAMDRITEQFIFTLLEKIKQDVAILIITHRIHIIKRISDYIYILENKTTDNHGTHEELMKYNNFYSQFWKELHIESNLLPAN